MWCICGAIADLLCQFKDPSQYIFDQLSMSAKFDSVFNDRVFDGFQSTYRVSKTVITKIQLNLGFVRLDKLVYEILS